MNIPNQLSKLMIKVRKEEMGFQQNAHVADGLPLCDIRAFVSMAITGIWYEESKAS